MITKGILCPNCGKELKKVNAYFEHVQTIDLNCEAVLNQETIFDEVTDVECVECVESIKDFCMNNEELRNLIYEAV